MNYELHVNYNGRGFVPVKARLHPCKGPLTTQQERMKDLVTSVAFGVTTPVPMEFRIVPIFRGPADKAPPTFCYRYRPDVTLLPSCDCLSVIVSPLGRRKALIEIIPYTNDPEC